jgi:hypothetical protein
VIKAQPKADQPAAEKVKIKKAKLSAEIVPSNRGDSSTAIVGGD